uniref:Uncharacterized protein n=1 Tax=Salix viminalis TaxID=40686 RepID=A0A6N2N159_SALVM
MKKRKRKKNCFSVFFINSTSPPLVCFSPMSFASKERKPEKQASLSLSLIFFFFSAIPSKIKTTTRCRFIHFVAAFLRFPSRSCFGLELLSGA